MAAWKYINGSEKDFEGAPEWATSRAHICDEDYFLDSFSVGGRYLEVGCVSKVPETFRMNKAVSYVLIAQRERVTSINDDRLAQDTGLNPKYNRPCKDVTIDVYDVLQAFNVTNPALQHLVKKALAVGQRGHKDKMEDLRDILASAQRAIELEEGKE